MRRPWLAQAMLLAGGLGGMTAVGAFAADAPSAVLSQPNAVSPVETAEISSAAGPASRPDKIVPVSATIDRVDVLEPGSSDRRSQQRALAALPLQRLTPAARGQAEAVLANLSMFRAMPTIRLEVDHDAYRYFVDHPDVAVAIWRVLGVSKCQLWQTGPDSYETEVGDGSIGVIDVLLRSNNEHLVLGQGQFKSPLLIKPIRATALLHLKTDFITDHDGKTQTICEGNLFVTFPSQTVETAAKVVSPMTNLVIDRNFEEIGLFAHMMTLAMRNQPGWVESIAVQLDGILERRRSELLQIAARVYVTQKRRESARDGHPVSADAISPPVRPAPVRR